MSRNKTLYNLSWKQGKIYSDLAFFISKKDVNDVEFIIGLVLGIFIGATVGIFIMALMSVNKKTKEK